MIYTSGKSNEPIPELGGNSRVIRGKFFNVLIEIIKFRLRICLEKFIKFSKTVSQIATDRFSKLQEVSNSEFLIAGRIKTVIDIVIQN